MTPTSVDRSGLNLLCFMAHAAAKLHTDQQYTQHLWHRLVQLLLRLLSHTVPTKLHAAVQQTPKTNTTE